MSFLPTLQQSVPVLLHVLTFTLKLLFHADGYLLMSACGDVVGCLDGSVQVRSFVTGLHCQHLEGHRSEVCAMIPFHRLVDPSLKQSQNNQHFFLLASCSTFCFPSISLTFLYPFLFRPF